MSYLDKIKVGSTTYDFHDTTIQEATQSVAGLMSASDKTKLDQINPQGLLYVDITVPLAIGSWTASGSNYEYSWTNALITNTAIIEVYLSDNARDGLVGDFTFVKVSGGLTFITNQAPVDNFTIIVRVIDSNVDGGIELLAENVETEAIAGATNVEEALTVLDGQDTTLNTKIESTKNEIAIVEDGNTATHEITDKQFVIWKDALYKANGAIHVGNTLSSSNLNAVSNGVANSLKAAVDDVNNNITTIINGISVINKFTLTNDFEYYDARIRFISGLVVINVFIRVKNEVTLYSNSALSIGNITADMKPFDNQYVRSICYIDGVDNRWFGFDVIAATAKLSIYNPGDAFTIPANSYIRIPTIVYKANG